MWYLKSDNDDRVMYIISQIQTVTIGRSVDSQVCNFAIPDDPSISRKHATLSVIDNCLVLQDLGSRYGTFINNSTEKVEINTNIKLKESDIVKFGKMNSVWKVNTVNLNTCTSTLKGENLQNLKATLSKIGGVLKNEWDDTCNYLTMPAITLTIKVVLALVQGSHIVTTEFWSNFLKSVTDFTVMPDPQKFMPAVMESTLNKEVVSFAPDVRRQSLFQDKKFIFLSRRQYEMYRSVLTRSGASTLLLGESKMTVSMLCEDNVVVIQYNANSASQHTQVQKNQINDIVKQLKNKGKRVIADAEIGLAILYCCTEKYCNPSFSFTSEVVKQNPESLAKTSKVLAVESQECSGSKREKENVKINETYTTDDKNNDDLSDDKLVLKRKISELAGETVGNANKKIATACSVADIPNESIKRKLSGNESSSNPSKKMALENECNDPGSSNSSEDILIDKDKSEDIFKFINAVPANGENENKVTKLNLSRPSKRKFEVPKEDGDLFNFVRTDDLKASQEEPSRQSIFSSNKLKRVDDTDTSIIKNTKTVTPEDISAMRGVKLKELMESSKSYSSTMQEHTVKQENNEDLEEKMGSLDLGKTVVTICSNLIVKKEPFKTELEDSATSVKNFKKFKKVWSMRKHQTVISTCSMSIADYTDTNSYSVAF